MACTLVAKQTGINMQPKQLRRRTVQMKCFSLAASEFYQVIKLSATVITLLEVSVEYADDGSGDIKACHVWSATRQELDEMGARDMIGEEVVIPMKGETERERKREQDRE